VEFIKNEDYKYVRALGAFYMRLVGTSMDVYQYLEVRLPVSHDVGSRTPCPPVTVGHRDGVVVGVLTWGVVHAAVV
jgi:hypothetical protein